MPFQAPCFKQSKWSVSALYIKFIAPASLCYHGNRIGKNGIPFPPPLRNKFPHIHHPHLSPEWRSGTTTTAALCFDDQKRQKLKKDLCNEDFLINHQLEESPQPMRPWWLFELSCYVTNHTETNGEKRCKHDRKQGHKTARHYKNISLQLSLSMAFY